MKVVIDIPEEYYHFCKRCAVNRTANPEQRIIANGTPLPKGHGRLIDADDLDVDTITTDDYNGNEVLEVVLKEDIDNASTIIEADEGE